MESTENDTGKNMLQVLEETLDIDVDWMDGKFIRSMDFAFYDMTSNQFIVDAEISRPETRPLIEEVAREMRGVEWLDVYTRVAANICKNNLSALSGRVFLQTRTCDAYDTQATLKYAHQIDAEMARAGIGRDRYGIKIPITGPAMVAARELHKEGITTLGTTLFNVEQAIAASQAGCYYVSPYFNELHAHVDASVWPKCDDPVKDHPMASRVAAMRAVFQHLYRTTGREQPRIKLASLLSTAECMAAASLGCHSVTIPQSLLILLAQTPAVTSLKGVKKGHPYKGEGAEGDAASVGFLQVDALADGGKKLDEAIEGDEETKMKLAYALEFFNKAEKHSQELVEAIMEEVKHE